MGLAKPIPSLGRDDSLQVLPKAVRPWTSKRSSAVQFQIKGQDYFLAFVEQERRWYVFSPTPQGIHRVPVYVDAVKYERSGTVAIETIQS